MTLTEILVVLGISSVLFAASSIASLKDLATSSLQTDHHTVVNALLLARSRAQAGMCSEDGCAHGRSFGIRKEGNAIVTFEGGTYASRFLPADISFEISSSEHSGDGSQIVFHAGNSQTESSASLNIGTDTRYRILISEDGAVDTRPLP